MAAPRSKRYFGLIIPFVLAACLVVGYWFYWSKAASEVETRVRTAIPVSVVSDVRITGFPYRLTLELGDLKLKSGNGLGFSSSRVVATASPFNPLLWVLEGAQDPALSLPGGPSRTLQATNLKASLRLNSAGFERLSLTFDGLEAQGEQGWGMGGGQVHFVSDPKNADIIAMQTDIRAIRIGKPLAGPSAILGQTINRIMIAGPISQGRALSNSLADWSKKGGKLSIMAGELMWGPIAFTGASGDITLSPAQKWQGNVRGTGALKPEGIAVSALSGPVDLVIADNRMSLNGLPGINIGNAFGAAE